MATKNIYNRSQTFITVTAEEIEALLIEKYAKIGVLPEVTFEYSSGYLECAVISYEENDNVIREQV